jgi:hypothetical protein
MDEELARLWREVEEGWGDAARHEAFLDHCRKTAQLPRAAAHYRGVVSTPGEDEESTARRADAQKRLNAIAFLAMQLLEGERTPTGQGLPRWFTVAVGVVTFLVVAWVVAKVLKS